MTEKPYHGLHRRDGDYPGLDRGRSEAPQRGRRWLATVFAGFALANVVAGCFIARAEERAAFLVHDCAFGTEVHHAVFDVLDFFTAKDARQEKAMRPDDGDIRSLCPTVFFSFKDPYFLSVAGNYNRSGKQEASENLQYSRANRQYVVIKTFGIIIFGFLGEIPFIILGFKYFNQNRLILKFLGVILFVSGIIWCWAFFAYAYLWRWPIQSYI